MAGSSPDGSVRGDDDVEMVADTGGVPPEGLQQATGGLDTRQGNPSAVLLLSQYGSE